MDSTRHPAINEPPLQVDASSPDVAPGVLILVENLPVPLDRRVWMEATTLRDAGYRVSIVCPAGRGFEKRHERIDGIDIYRHPLPPERSSALGYLREYGHALFHQWRLARKIHRECGFVLLHACNPPDLLCLIAAWFKLSAGVRFLFDHHDLCPELYESKFGRRGLFHLSLRWAERCTFALADTVICTNESYREVARTRGHKSDSDLFVVRSGPRLECFGRVDPNPVYRRGRRFLVGYVGVMGEFDGVDHLIRAAHELIVRRGRGDVHFCLIGMGPMFENLQELATTLAVQDRMEFAGRVSDHELLERLSTCDVGVTPDPLNPLNDRSTMNKTLEYMAVSLPVVQYDLREGRRSAGDASLYARPNDPADLATKIESLLDDAEARTRMGRIGRQRMEQQLEWRHQAPALLDAYAHALRPRERVKATEQAWTAP